MLSSRSGNGAFAAPAVSSIAIALYGLVGGAERISTFVDGEYLTLSLSIATLVAEQPVMNGIKTENQSLAILIVSSIHERHPQSQKSKSKLGIL
jgi:hypothetical protein